MNTFLDDNKRYGSTFLLYGNINDDFYCPDASIQKMDQYLATLLKKRGYEHILFYGSSGTRGAYCLDEASARFFFNANEGVPQVEALRSRDDNEPEQPGQPAASGDAPATSRGSVGSRIRAGRNRRGTGYRPGSLSDEAGGSTSDTSGDSSAQAQQSEAPARVQYALRKLNVGSFYPQFRDKMLDPDSHMAIVFYNVLTDYGTQNSIFIDSMKDDVLVNYSQIGDPNLCLIVAPDTMINTNDLQRLLQSNGLGSKFLKPVGPTEFTFNPQCCFQLGYPGVDEIKNMLHRFAVVGTSHHRRIHFDYGKVDQLAEQILANSSIVAQRQNKPEERKMRVIASRLEAYIHSHVRGHKRPEITVDIVNDIWDVHIDPQEAMKKLQLRGWENAYNGVCSAVKAAHNAVKQRTATDSPKEHIPDMGLERYAQCIAKENGPRPPIPNFILLGNPGTGKTEIARLIGQILHAEGILKVGHTVEVGRNHLTSSYVAGVPKATMAQVDKAEEGVLFIDEAHSLGRKDGGEHHEGTGVEVVSTLNAAITDPNRHFCTILAGYPKQMQAVFDLDPGFRRRFQVEIHLDDYEPELLYEILLGKIRQCNYQVSETLTGEHTAEDGKTYIPLLAMTERVFAERDRENFGNAGDMVTLANYAVGRNTETQVLQQEHFYGGLGKITSEFFVPMNLGMTKEKIFKTMEENFVGMKNVKKMLERMALSIERTLAKGNSPDDIALDPIILVGNPGTGKTTVAHMLAQLYYYYGILGSPKLIERNASSMTSIYQNDTRAVEEAIMRAQNSKGFLFVDEAHNLDATSLKAFMAPLTDRSKPFVACFAVYEDQLEKFLALDPGSRSRFEKNIIRLEDYLPEELYEILVRAMEKEGYSADQRTHSMLRQLMERVYATRTTQTGNARHVLNIFSDMKNELNARCAQQGIPFTSPESFQFIETDIPADLRKGLSAGDDTSRLEELDALSEEIRTHRVGNRELKDLMLGYVEAMQFRLKYPELSGDIIEPGHFFFKGNAGTGKTTSVNYLGKVLFQLGITKDPNPVALSASHLVGQYLGQTAVQTRELLEQNMGRLIMIDEAYALADSNDRANSYKRDAINTLVAKLDDEVFRKTTCVVFLGYEGDLDGLYRENQGLRSRVKEVLFPDFTQEECVKILRSMLEDRKAQIGDDVLAQCGEQIAFLRSCSGFSNGRTLRKYAEALVSRRNKRIMQSPAQDAQQPDFTNIRSEDLPQTQALPKMLNL